MRAPCTPDSIKLPEYSLRPIESTHLMTLSLDQTSTSVIINYTRVSVKRVFRFNSEWQQATYQLARTQQLAFARPKGFCRN